MCIGPQLILLVPRLMTAEPTSELDNGRTLAAIIVRPGECESGLSLVGAREESPACTDGIADQIVT